MATIDSKDFIDKIIAGNGRIDPEDAPDNPWAIRITEYTNAYGNVTWGIVFQGQDINKYQVESPYIRKPKIIWERK